jgi:hypothetical protein
MDERTSRQQPTSALTEAGATLWLRRDAWSIGEAAILLTGRDPDGVVGPKTAKIGARKVVVETDPLDLAGEMGERLRRAEMAGALVFPAPPGDVIGWALNKRLNLPDPLLKNGDRRFYGLREAGSHTQVLETAQGFRESVREVHERQDRGYYTLREVAQLLAEANGLDSRTLLRQLTDAWKAGTLIVRDLRTQAPLAHGEPLRDFMDWVTPDDLDALLAKWGVSYRLPRRHSNPRARGLQPKLSPQQQSDVRDRRKHVTVRPSHLERGI